MHSTTKGQQYSQHIYVNLIHALTDASVTAPNTNVICTRNDTDVWRYDAPTEVTLSKAFDVTDDEI